MRSHASLPFFYRFSDHFLHFSDCTQKRIDLQVVTSPSIPALGASCIVADASRLAQILINFLANSVKLGFYVSGKRQSKCPNMLSISVRYTSESVLRRIIVHLDAYEQIAPKKPGAIRVAEPEDLTIAPNQLWVSIGVEDTGKGLSSDDLKKLFIRFSQANPRSDQCASSSLLKKDYVSDRHLFLDGGSGLGLYVCKKLVELHHGFIEVESAPGKVGQTWTLVPSRNLTRSVHRVAFFGSPSPPLVALLYRTLRQKFTALCLLRSTGPNGPRRRLRLHATLQRTPEPLQNLLYLYTSLSSRTTRLIRYAF